MDKFLSHLAEKRTKLQKQLRRLEGEIADLDKAERLYRDSGAAPEPHQVEIEINTKDDWRTEWPSSNPVPAAIAQAMIDAATKLPGGKTTHHVSPGAGKTIKERVLQLLERNPLGLTSSQILNNLNIDGGGHVSRESLSPQLSRLRTDDKKIDLEHGVWSLKHETPAG